MGHEKETQVVQILKHLKTHGSITAREAEVEYGIQRLAARMNNIKNRGIKFDVVTERGLNRFGKKTRYARYILVREEETA